MAILNCLSLGYERVTFQFLASISSRVINFYKRRGQEIERIFARFVFAYVLFVVCIFNLPSMFLRIYILGKQIFVTEQIFGSEGETQIKI